MAQCAWVAGNSVGPGASVALHQCAPNYELTFEIVCVKTAPQWWASQEARFNELNAAEGKIKAAALAPGAAPGGELLGTSLEQQTLSSDQAQIGQAVAQDKQAQAQLQQTLQQQGDSKQQVASSEQQLEAEQVQALKQLIQAQEQKQSAMTGQITQAEQSAGLLAPAPAPVTESDWHTASAISFTGQLRGNKGQLSALRKQEASAIQAQVAQEVTELTSAQNSALAEFVASQTQQEENLANGRRRRRRI